MWRSVPQMDATLTLTRTSVRPYLGTVTSRISAPGAASGLTTASMVLGMEVPFTSAELEEQTLYLRRSRVHLRLSADCCRWLAPDLRFTATFCTFRECASLGSQSCV